jgi:hypothetical protein
VQANRKHPAKTGASNGQIVVCRRASGIVNDEETRPTRSTPRVSMTVGLASKTPGRNRPEIGGRGGVVLQANCKQWIQERPGSVRHGAEDRNTKSQFKAHFLPLDSAQRHSKYHPKWLFKSPHRHQLTGVFSAGERRLARSGSHSRRSEDWPKRVLGHCDVTQFQ